MMMKEAMISKMKNKENINDFFITLYEMKNIYEIIINY